MMKPVSKILKRINTMEYNLGNGEKKDVIYKIRYCDCKMYIMDIL